MTNESQAREAGEKFAAAAADMIRRGLPLDVCARKLIAAVCVMGQERLVFGPMQATLADVDEKLKALTLEVAEMRDDALEGARVESGTACATQHEWPMREDSVIAEFIRERFKGYTQDLEKRKHATLKIGDTVRMSDGSVCAIVAVSGDPSVATEPPVDVPCAKCGVGQRKHKTHWATKVGPGVCSEWRAGNP